jgi:uncharacterized protein (TIGR02145 family)
LFFNDKIYDLRMKKILLFLLILSNSALLYSQQPVLKVIMTDGNSSQYKIDEISNLTFSNPSDSLVMKLFFRDSLTAYYSISLIDSIKVDSSAMNIFIKGYPRKYLITELDSISFIIDPFQMITIGNQVWMARNLAVVNYRNGDTIQHITEQDDWWNTLDGAWCNFQNNIDMGFKYGRLYNWFAVGDPRGLAPAGWHIPSDEEWKILEMNLGMSRADADSDGWRSTTVGGKLKDSGSFFWVSPNTGATNESGFSALPGCCRFDDGGFSEFVSMYGFWWTSTSIGTWNALGRTMMNSDAGVYRGYNMKEYGFSVRCVKDK